MIGTTLSHYQLLERLGAGGMGVVYRARDQRLERDVAIKLLPSGSPANEAERRRFRREALALSRLNHPGIAVIHEFDRDGGTEFLVMELVSGATLAERIQAGPLPEGELIAFGIQIAEALDAAHQEGVLHRDLKPGNIVVTPRGFVKLLDFGLATVLQPPGDSQALTRDTSPGTLIGTLGYMGPEQLQGLELDARADLYGLGVVLYEMATGHLPFVKTPVATLMYDIAHTPPPPPSRSRSDISPGLEALILRALEKDPGARFQSAREMAEALRQGSTGDVTRRDTPAPTPGEPRRIESLAVLPLENLSGDPEQEFFADGMTEVLIADLAQIGALRVISRTTAMQYKGAKRPLPEIARALRVDAVVEGSVSVSGGRVRVTAQLIEAASDRNLWAQRYERPLGDVLALQGEVAKTIAEEIRVKLTPHEERRLTRPRAVDPAAFDAYLRGRFFWNKRSLPELRKSLDHFQRALEIDPVYALAYAGIADAWNMLGETNALPAREGFARARAAAERALEIDPGLGEAYTSRAFVELMNDFDWPRAEADFLESLRLHPGYATGHQWYAEFLSSQARLDEAIAEAQRARDLDPLSPAIGVSLAETIYFAGRIDEAAELLRQVVELEPGLIGAHSDLGRACALVGKTEEAIAAFQRAATLSGGDELDSAGLAHALAVGGRTEEARRRLPRLEERVRLGQLNPYAIATVYTGLDERDWAFAWLERAFDEHDRGLVWLAVNPRMTRLRGDPRLADLMRRLKLPG